MAAWIDALATKVDCGPARDPGRVTIRRLNRAEYNNTIRDLVGVDFQPADDFPSDDVGYGFDNIGDVLTMPPILMEKYLAAAEKIARQADRAPKPTARRDGTLPDENLLTTLGPLAKQDKRVYPEPVDGRDRPRVRLPYEGEYSSGSAPTASRPGRTGEAGDQPGPQAGRVHTR